MGNDGEWIIYGSRTTILKERKGLKGDRLMEHRRDNPLDEYDMFAFASGVCEFDEERFIEHIQFLEEHPDVAFWRQGRWDDEYDKEKKKLIIKWIDDKNGPCFIQEFPEEDIFYVDRPKLIKQFNRQIFFTCLFFGAKVNVEIDAGTWFYEDFLEWDALQLLEWTPALDLTRPNQKILPGTQSGNPFELAKQLEVAKLYFDGNSQLVYNGNVQRVTYIPLLKEGLQYNHSERGPFHLMVSYMMALLPMLGRPRPRGGERPAQRPKHIMPQKKIKLPS